MTDDYCVLSPRNVSSERPDIRQRFEHLPDREFDAEAAFDLLDGFHQHDRIGAHLEERARGIDRRGILFEQPRDDAHNVGLDVFGLRHGL